VKKNSFSLGFPLWQRLTDLFSQDNLEISLYLLKHPDGVIYRSTLIAQLTSRNLQLPRENLLKVFDEDIRIRFIDNYALDFQLNDRFLNVWLETVYQLILVDFPCFLRSDSIISIQSEFSQLQYSHARCCAHLRQLYQQQIITEQGYLINSHELVNSFAEFNSADWNLLKSIISISDNGYSGKLVNNLSLAVLDWERYSGIWRAKPQLRDIKAILLILARFYLNNYLEKHLQILAPVEL